MTTDSKHHEVLKRVTSKGVFPYQWAFTLLLPIRNLIFSPQQLVKRIGLKEDYTVLELGPGPGYFSIPVARKLKNGKLHLADIQQEMLDYAKKRCDKRKLTNIEYHLCNGKTLDFEDHAFDIIYMVTVIGEVENKEDYIREFYRILKPKGILSITELAGDPDKITVDELISMIVKHQFSFLEQFGSNKNFTLNFTK